MVTRWRDGCEARHERSASRKHQTTPALCASPLPTSKQTGKRPSAQPSVGRSMATPDATRDEAAVLQVDLDRTVRGPSPARWGRHSPPAAAKRVDYRGGGQKARRPSSPPTRNAQMSPHSPRRRRIRWARYLKTPSRWRPAQTAHTFTASDDSRQKRGTEQNATSRLSAVVAPPLRRKHCRRGSTYPMGPAEAGRTVKARAPLIGRHRGTFFPQLGALSDPVVARQAPRGPVGFHATIGGGERRVPAEAPSSSPPPLSPPPQQLAQQGRPIAGTPVRCPPPPLQNQRRAPWRPTRRGVLAKKGRWLPHPMCHVGARAATRATKWPRSTHNPRVRTATARRRKSRPVRVPPKSEPIVVACRTLGSAGCAPRTAATRCPH